MAIWLTIHNQAKMLWLTQNDLKYKRKEAFWMNTAIWNYDFYFLQIKISWKIIEKTEKKILIKDMEVENIRIMTKALNIRVQCILCIVILILFNLWQLSIDLIWVTYSIVLNIIGLNRNYTQCLITAIPEFFINGGVFCQLTINSNIMLF
jgi:hypothetical protein